MMTYALNPARAARALRQGLRNSVLLYGGAGILVLAAINRGDFSRSGVVSIVAGSAVMVLLIALLLWASVRAYHRQAATFRLTVDAEQITREVAQAPTVTLRRAEITALEDYPGVGLRVCGTAKSRQIFIPMSLEGYEELRAQLAAAHPLVTKQSQGQLLLRYAGGAAIPVVLLGALSFAPTCALATVVGIVIVIGTGGLAAYLQRNDTVPRWFKVMMWLAVPLMIVVVLLRLRRFS